MSRSTLTFASGMLLIGLHAAAVAGRGSSDPGPRCRSTGSKPNSGSGRSNGACGVGGLSLTDGFREERLAVAAGESVPHQPVANGEIRSLGPTAARPAGAALFQRASRVTHWPAQLCVLAAIALQVVLSHQLTVGPRWLLPSLEGVLLIGLTATTPSSTVHGVQPVRQRVGIGLIALVNAANSISLYLLAHELVYKDVSNGRALIFSGLAIWLTNVLIFALWYWQLDRGGPVNRARRLDPHTPEGRPDFVFPEMASGRPYTPDDWMPQFLDYLALGVTTATAFSPADAMPISWRAKALMSTQAMISLITLGLIISRAVGILS